MGCEVRWLVRSGISADQVQIAYYPNASSAYADVFFKTQSGYAGFTMRAIASGGRGGINSTWNLISSNEAYGTTTSNKGSSYECWASIASAGTALHGKAYTGSAVGYDNGGVSSATYSTYVKDIGNSSDTTFAYSKSGMSYGDYTWLAGWNGYELRAVHKSQFAQAHSHPYLPLSGGTMTGNIHFADIGNTGSSAGITFAGSTDGAGIYYQTTGADQGNLVLNLQDDSNCYLRIAKNGSFRSYFSPDDGNFHGNVNGRADTAGTADNATKWNGVTMRNNHNTSDTWIPVYSNNAMDYVLKSEIANLNGVAARGDHYIRFTDGTRICWGNAGTGGSGKATFANAFTNIVTVTLTSNGALKYAPYTTGITTTYFT